MTFEIVKLQNPPSERVIDACVELLDAGRPVSEILAHIRRMSKEGLPCLGPDVSEPQAAQGQVVVAAEEHTAEQPSVARSASEPTRGRRNSHRLWPMAAVVLLAGAAAIAGRGYLPRATPSASAVTSAPAPSSALSPIRSPADAGTAHDPEQAAPPTPQIRTLVERGTALVGSGELAAARLYYEPAANAGSAQAAVYLGETYDPFFLRRGRFGKSVRGDVRMAEYWFRRAQQLGSKEAETRLTELRRK